MPFIKHTLPLVVILCISLLSSCTNNDSEISPTSSSSLSDISSSSVVLSSSSSATVVVSSSSIQSSVSSSSLVQSSSSSSPPSSSSVSVPSSSSVRFQSGVIYGDSVTYQGEIYQTVVIGTQTWFQRNLNYAVEGSKCYNNDEANCATYGRLYDWAAAMALPISCNFNTCASQVDAKYQGICPNGWHIPSATDWNVLMKYVDPGSFDNSYSEHAGTVLKATSGWNSYYEQSGNGRDTYGFTALPGGVGYSNGYFGDNVGESYWWSSAEENINSAYLRWMDYHDYVLWGYHNKSNFYRIRCMKD